MIEKITKRVLAFLAVYYFAFGLWDLAAFFATPSLGQFVEASEHFLISLALAFIAWGPFEDMERGRGARIQHDTRGEVVDESRFAHLFGWSDWHPAMPDMLWPPFESSGRQFHNQVRLDGRVYTVAGFDQGILWLEIDPTYCAITRPSA